MKKKPAEDTRHTLSGITNVPISQMTKLKNNSYYFFDVKQGDFEIRDRMKLSKAKRLASLMDIQVSWCDNQEKPKKKKPEDIQYSF